MERKVRDHEVDGVAWSVRGRRLEAGDVLEEGDLYASSAGRWERCPCPGLTLREGTDAVWVRPVE
jgi:hypothetical protein